jgi:hypothetical protein
MVEVVSDRVTLCPPWAMEEPSADPPTDSWCAVVCKAQRGRVVDVVAHARARQHVRHRLPSNSVGLLPVASSFKLRVWSRSTLAKRGDGGIYSPGQQPPPHPMRCESRLHPPHLTLRLSVFQDDLGPYAFAYMPVLARRDHASFGSDVLSCSGGNATTSSSNYPPSALLPSSTVSRGRIGVRHGRMKGCHASLAPCVQHAYGWG